MGPNSLIIHIVLEELHRLMFIMAALAELHKASRYILAGATSCAIEVHHHKCLWVCPTYCTIKLLRCKSTGT